MDIPQGKLTQGTEISKYLEEEKSIEIPLVVRAKREQSKPEEH